MFSIWLSGPKENKAQLNKTVEDEYKTWSSMSNEHDIVQVKTIDMYNEEVELYMAKTIF